MTGDDDKTQDEVHGADETATDAAPESVDAEAIELVHTEPVLVPRDPGRYDHLNQNRSLIIKRTLLCTVFGAAIPLPVLDDLITTRIRTGLFMRLAKQRQVGLTAEAGDVLAQSPGIPQWRRVTTSAATMLAMKLAWRKFMTAVAAGRGAEEAADLYQSALLFDHYATRLHVGPALTPEQAGELRKLIHKAVSQSNRDTIRAVFKDGARNLGRSILQAPQWVRDRLVALAMKFAQTGGGAVDPSTVDFSGLEPENKDDLKWLDRTAQRVDQRIQALGQGYLDQLVGGFDRLYMRARADKAAKENAETKPEKAGRDTPPPETT